MADLFAVFKKAPKEAVRFLAERRQQPSDGWETVSAQAHQHAFTVAQTAGFDVLGDIRAAIEQARDQGLTHKQFQEQLKPLLQAKGWWGQAIDPETGEILKTYPGTSRPVRYGTPARLKLIYDQNMAGANAAGRRERQLASAKLFPFWRIVAVMDGRTRPTHRALNGKVFPADHPIWAIIYPPQGFRCRCIVQALTQAQVDKAGIQVEGYDGEVVERQVPVNAGRDLLTVRGWKTADGREFWPDPGFDQAPGLKGHEATERLFKAASRSFPTTEALDVVRKNLGSELSRSSWKAFVQDAMASPVSRGRSAVLGVLSEADLAAAIAKGKPADSPVVYVEDRLLVGKKARRHEEAGNALTEQEWLQLAGMFQAPVMRLWDVKNETLINVYPSSDARQVKIAVDINRFKVGKDARANRAATVFKVTEDDLKTGITAGQYEVLK
jgi:SPP1 gp7 family putative phage head morphogenesis protein